MVSMNGFLRVVELWHPQSTLRPCMFLTVVSLWYVVMSSHDSLDIVYRCLFKGAADFLVKPVRKNELKNLWQHVWRCQSVSLQIFWPSFPLLPPWSHLVEFGCMDVYLTVGCLVLQSSGSGSGGSGSGSGMRKFMQPKSRVGSGNNSGSNDGSEDGSSGLNVRGGSDNGSGTQTVAEHVQTREKQKRDQEEGQATSLQKASGLLLKTVTLCFWFLVFILSVGATLHITRFTFAENLLNLFFQTNKWGKTWRWPQEDLEL